MNPALGTSKVTTFVWNSGLDLDQITNLWGEKLSIYRKNKEYKQGRENKDLVKN